MFAAKLIGHCLARPLGYGLGEAPKAMKFNIEGRIRNMRLPDGKTALIYSIYEAVINGVHAIEERFGETDAPIKGIIHIHVEEDSDKAIESIEVSDNGIGLTDRHLRAFDECDTLEKASRQHLQRGSLPACAAHGPWELPPFSTADRKVSGGDRQLGGESGQMAEDV
jgi:hypothetical protein